MKIVFNNSQKMDEIIFANRNKSYGAYAIRSAYNSTLFKSLGIVITSLFVIIGSIYIATRKGPEIIHQADGNLGCIGIPIDLTPIEKPKVTPPGSNNKPPKSNAMSTVIRDTANINNQNNVTNNNNNPIGDPNGDPNTNPNTGTGTGTGTNSVVVTETVAIESPTAFPVEDPEFEGGFNALRDYIGKNLTYPDLAREIGKEGTVYVSFVIDEKGLVESTKVLKGIGAGCDEEAVRVVSKIPKFKKPGKNAAGKPVKVLYNIPIAFKLK